MAKVKTIEIVDIENVRKEKLRYQKNSVAYWLAMLGCVCSILAGFIGLNTVKPTNVTVLKILLNIVILLFGFSCSEMVKKYSTKASIALFVFAGVDVLRILWMPRLMFKWAHNDDISHFCKVVFDKEDSGRGWLPASATFRGILMTIFLICSAIAFSFAGYVGISKSRKLHAYLNSINVKY